MTDTNNDAKTVEDLRNEPAKDIVKVAKPVSLSLEEIKANPALALLHQGTFDHMYRIADGLARSQLVPKAFQGKPDDCFIAVQMSISLECLPLMILQNMYIIHGSPAFSSKFAIALANNRGRFRDGIHFNHSDHKLDDDDYRVTAYATLKSTGKIVSRSVSLGTAKLEGWYKNNTKYQSIPDQMLAYRAAMFLIRLYCPEVLFGMSSADELIDLRPDKNAIEGEIVSYGPGEDALNIEPEGEPGAAKESEADEVEGKPQTSGPTFKDACTMIMKCDVDSEDDLAITQDLISEFSLDDQKKLKAMLDNKMKKPPDDFAAAGDAPEEKQTME